MTTSQILTNVIAFTAIILPLLFQIYKFRKERNIALELNENNNLQLEIFNNLLSIQSVNLISKTVNDIFRDTIADRFLILTGLEVKGKMHHVSVIFEQHNGGDTSNVNAIATYRNVEIDDDYRIMVRDAELRGLVSLEVSTMREGVLKYFYNRENITHSDIRFVNRQFIDKGKDIVCFSSIATHQNQAFSKEDQFYIKDKYDQIIVPLIKKILGDDEIDEDKILLN